MEDIAPLDDAQAAHVFNLRTLLAEYGVGFDLSPTGSGKTFQALMAWLQLRDLHRLFVVCPAALTRKWEDAIEGHAWERDVVVMSYNALGGTRKRKTAPDREVTSEDGKYTTSVSHSEVAQGLLVRTDEEVVLNAEGEEDDEKKKVVKTRVLYETSERWDALVRSPGVFLVLDEAQSIKNSTANATSAAQALLKCTSDRDSDPCSYALLTSASPMDKEEHVLHMLRTMGHLPSDQPERYVYRQKTQECLPGNDQFGPNAVLRWALALTPTMTAFRERCITMTDRDLVFDIEREAFEAEQLRMLGLGGESRPVEADAALRESVRDAVVRWGTLDSRTRSRITQRFRQAGLPENPVGAKAVKALADGTRRYAFLLFVRCVLPRQSSCKMPSADTGCGVRVVSALFQLKEEDDTRVRYATEDIHLGLAMLQRSRAIAASSGGANATSVAAQGRSKITYGQMDLEFSKKDTVFALTERALEVNPRAKVVIALNYTETLETLTERLARWEPLVIRGNTAKELREERRRLFQDPNSGRRLLIGNVAVIGHGIDLDDQHGDSPRLVILVPSYDTIKLYQLAGRVDRALTRSSAKMLVVYTTAGLTPPEGQEVYAIPPPYGEASAEYPNPLTELGEGGEERTTPMTDISCCETGLMRALCRKGDVMTTVMNASETEKRKVPGNSRTWVQQLPAAAPAPAPAVP